MGSRVSVMATVSGVRGSVRPHGCRPDPSKFSVMAFSNLSSLLCSGFFNLPVADGLVPCVRNKQASDLPPNASPSMGDEHNSIVEKSTG
ncbi:unnamed protein product [Urochloa humidicola]